MPHMPNKDLQKAAVKFTRWVGSTQSLMVHTVFFVVSFLLAYLGIIPFDRMLLVLTTIVSLEAIYLSIFIQISINSANAAIAGVEHDIDEIQEDVEEIQEDVDEIQEDVEGIEKDVDEIQEDVEGIEKDVDELQEDVEEMTEEEKKDADDKKEAAVLAQIQKDLKKLMKDIDGLSKRE